MTGAVVETGLWKNYGSTFIILIKKQTLNDKNYFLKNTIMRQLF